MKATISLLLAGMLALIVGCDEPDQAARTTEPPADAVAPAAGVAADARGAAEDRDLPRVVFLGDSLTAGYGLDVSEAFPALVGQMLAEEGLPVEVVNAGVSGDTTAGGLGRIDWLLRQSPDIVVVGLGGNDGLRGVDPAASEQNLRAIIERSRAAGARVLLLGMLIPPNYGPEYTAAFRDVYPRLAEEMDVPLVPFLLEGVGGDLRLNQSDGIHPTAAGNAVVARTVAEHLRPLVKEELAERSLEQQPVPSPSS